jgi:peroxiredoxin
VCVYADRNGSFVRLLGLDLGGPDASPKCQRFAAILEDGILLKLVRLRCSCATELPRRHSA